MKIQLYNSLQRKKSEFNPIHPGKVGLYTCGPTVYNFAHIGNLRTYVFEDILKRVLRYNDFQVKHVMNITDVGHLTGDRDMGEDKMEKGAQREGRTAWEIAEFYTRAFKSDIERLNIIAPDIWVKATDTIDDQIALIKILEEKDIPIGQVMEFILIHPSSRITPGFPIRISSPCWKVPGWKKIRKSATPPISLCGNFHPMGSGGRWNGILPGEPDFPDGILNVPP